MRLRNLMNPAYIYERREHIVPFIKSRASRLTRPVLDLFHILAAHGVPVTANDRKLAALKDKHKGQRCFVIGNGPSLRISDLDRLKGEITIASNKIYLAFEQTDWRPTYWTSIDGLVINNIAKEICALPFPKILPSGTEHIFRGCENVMFCDLGVDWLGVNDFRPGFSADIRDKAYGGESVTYFNIQIAYYLGCREIYLIGVDFSFKIPDKKVPDEGYEYILVSEGEQNHFIKDYRPVGEKWTMPHLREQEMAFEYCKQFMSKHGGKVYNASRKTALKVFERVDFDSLFDPR